MKTVSNVNSAYREETAGKVETLKCARHNYVTISRNIRESFSSSGVNGAVYGNRARINMVSTSSPVGAATLNRMRNTFCGIPKAEIERRNIALLQAMTVSLMVGYLGNKRNYARATDNTKKTQREIIYKLLRDMMPQILPFLRKVRSAYYGFSRPSLFSRLFISALFSFLL